MLKAHLWAAAVFAACCPALFAISYVGLDSADARMYQYTPNPGSAEFMKIFGDGNTSVAPSTGSGTGWDPSQASWAYGFMQWDISNFTPGVQYHVISASVTVTHVKNPTWSTSSTLPVLELHSLGSNWDENISFQNPANPRPGALLANAQFPSNIPANQDFEGFFNLTTPQFETILNNSIQGGKISFALASSMLPDATTRTPYYNLYTRDSPVNFTSNVTPVLTILAVPVPEPSTWTVMAGFTVSLILMKKFSP